MQDCITMKPAQRGNMDFVFLCREPNVNVRKKLHTHFFGIIPRFHDFCDILDRCTADYGCLVFDNTVRSNKIEDCVFWYKARYPIPKYKFGNNDFWEFHYKNKKKKRTKKTKNVIVIKN